MQMGRDPKRGETPSPGPVSDPELFYPAGAAVAFRRLARGGEARLLQQFIAALTVIWYALAQDGPMRDMLSKFAELLASLIATDHGERMYSDF
jgi:hypothetical protein